MARLRRADCSGPGISRRRRGRGFSYLQPGGAPVSDAAVLERINDLAIPPAWADVWICPWPNGHLQATGTDAAGRRQYRYHDQWRVRRDHEKFDRMLDFAAVLPKLRATVTRDLRAGGDPTQPMVSAAAVRLLDAGLFRIGGEEYAEQHETFGVASLRQEHVVVEGPTMVFDYPAKGSAERIVTVEDAQAGAVVAALRRRRSGGPNLFAYKRSRRWCDLHAQDVNDYLKASAGEQFSAKDFRTWSATVLAAAALGATDPVPGSPTARRRAVRAAMVSVSALLGNTPAVCRSAYVDPRVIDRFEGGETIAATLTPVPDLDALVGRAVRRNGARQRAESAVVELITSQRTPPARRRR